MLSILPNSLGATRTVRIFAHGPSTMTLLSSAGLVEPRRACLPWQTESRSPAVPRASRFSSLCSMWVYSAGGVVYTTGQRK